jgi:autotransporter-associated beta strand protein
VNNLVVTIGDVWGAGQIKLGSGTLKTGGDNTSTVYTGVISGTGNLYKQGAGTFTLTGTSTYTGKTQFEGLKGTGPLGTLMVNGSLASSSVVVKGNMGNLATLSGTGKVGQVTVNSGGTIDPGSGGTGTLTTGPVTFNAGSTFVAELGGQLKANGTVNLGAGPALKLAFSANPPPKKMVILGTARVGTFQGQPEGNQIDMAGMIYTVHYKPVGVELDLFA